MKTKATANLAYEAPEASVDVIQVEQCFLNSLKTNQLNDMNWNSLGGEDDMDVDY